MAVVYKDKIMSKFIVQ